MRLLISSILAVGVTISIFFGMEIMTSSKDMKQLEKKDIPHLVYLRETKDSKIIEKKRVQPKKPEPEQPQKVEFKKPKLDMKIEKNVEIKPIMAKNIDLSNISSLTGAQINVSVGLIDANSLTTLSRAYPKYPRRAKFKRKEGFVQLQFQIDAKGYVRNPVVLKAEPADLFEKSALKAIKRWRFKPTKGAKEDDMIDATITFNYRLAK